MAAVPATEVERVFREEYGRAVSVLVRIFGDIDLAEEAVQDAFAAALERWPEAGTPPDPARWIVATARNRTIDRLRRESSRADRHAEAASLRARGESFDAGDDGAGESEGGAGDEATASDKDGPMRDDRLRLIFLCCHPALAADARVAMTLRLVGGLATAEIARAFLVPEATMAQRLVRAKAKVRDARIPYHVPDESVLPSRVQAVLAVVYLVFNEGYAASSGGALVRDDLCREAVRLGRLLAQLMPDDEEVMGLLALMLLVESRRATRTTPDGDLVLLADQDRGAWDRALIDEGHAIVRRCLRRNRPGRYQIQAAIHAVHCDARSARDTDWRQIVALYDQLMSIAPSPVVALNRAVAVAEVAGAEAALALVDELELDGFHMFHAIRADMLRRLGRNVEAASAYDAAIARSGNAIERDFLQRRRQAVLPSG
jgi:RNA polymerase sigma-70 factor (ECF subfamily)